VGELILNEQFILRKEMEMKKYMTPEMEVVKLNYKTALLSASDGTTSTVDVPDTPTPGGPTFDD